MESHKRTIIKTVVFRIFGVIITFVITYLLTNKVVESGEIAIITNIALMIAYYIHERIWDKVDYGRSK